MTRTSLAAILCLLAAQASAHAAPPSVPTALEERAGRLLVTLDLSAAFPPGLQKVLSNGLTNVVTVHVALVPEHGEPVALYGREVDVLYDVWDEAYGVTVKDPTTPRGRVARYRDWPALLRSLSTARAVDLGPAGELGARRWFIQARVELNPVSQELIERTREFIANPAASARGAPASRSVLGAMASYFLTSDDPGEDVHVFRSGPFTARDVNRP